MLLSQLLGKKIVCLTDTADLGNVESLLFNENLTAAIYLKAGARLIPVEQIFKISDAVVIKSCGEKENIKDIKLAGEAQTCGDKTVRPEQPQVEQASFSLYKTPLYSTAGKFLGSCEDVLLTNGLKVKGIITAEKNYTPRAVFSAGQSVLIKAALPKGESLSYAVKTQNHEIVYGDFTFLIGKKLGSSLLDRQGCLLAARGQKISDRLLMTAKIHGKLKELAVKAKEM